MVLCQIVKILVPTISILKNRFLESFKKEDSERVLSVIPPKYILSNPAYYISENQKDVYSQCVNATIKSQRILKVLKGGYLMYERIC